jgi:hypothetical protein
LADRAFQFPFASKEIEALPPQGSRAGHRADPSLEDRVVMISVVAHRRDTYR